MLYYIRLAPPVCDVEDTNACKNAIFIVHVCILLYEKFVNIYRVSPITVFFLLLGYGSQAPFGGAAARFGGLAFGVSAFCRDEGRIGEIFGDGWNGGECCGVYKSGWMKVEGFCTTAASFPSFSIISLLTL